MTVASLSRPSTALRCYSTLSGVISPPKTHIHSFSFHDVSMHSRQRLYRLFRLFIPWKTELFFACCYVLIEFLGAIFWCMQLWIYTYVRYTIDFARGEAAAIWANQLFLEKKGRSTYVYVCAYASLPMDVICVYIFAGLFFPDEIKSV